ncbi:MAG: class I SAM-dependent methyltransferase [Candidatus Omnitrophica bacterium]|nr:class I SAM-dependent methyltransferase [Candidatus Omnitrophota bacterium]
MRIKNSQSKEEYCKIQITASKTKFRYCKVSTRCVQRFSEVVRKSSGGKIKGPVLCLGTRNGRELDLFRIYFFGNFLHKLIVRLFERRRYAFSSWFSFTELFGASDIKKIGERSVVGVELNPDGKRKDVFIGSFDELPAEWTSKFRVVFANTLDHAFDPYKAAGEWNRVLAPGGHIIISFPGEKTTESFVDSVSNITLEDTIKLFPGELVYFNKFGTIFSDVIIKKTDNI